ncbi:MAG: hypothetical protein J5732_01935 [Bacteroidaceae bacterium]|nr:hypothetical protein [Bacteroidaceae bacterium]
MKRLRLQILTAIVSGGIIAVTSCSKAEEGNPFSEQLPEACIVDTIYYQGDTSNNCITYVINYPSTDPFGRPVTLSGTITMLRHMLDREETFKGCLLYNHYTVFSSEEVPSRGDLVQQCVAAAYGLVIVSPDYYGFGVTVDKPQAYCISRANGKAALDCYISARKILADKGIECGDDLITCGYSQGAQTTVGVLREVAENHPEIRVRKAFAGDGPYDINTIYNKFVLTDFTVMPSTVANVIYSYNYFFGLGYSLNEMFIGRTAENFEEWFLSKKYDGDTIEQFMGTTKCSDFIAPAVLDRSTVIGNDFLTAFAHDNLSKDWSPRSDFDVTIYHDINDDAVPVENSRTLIKFLKENGVKVEDIIADHSTGAGDTFGQTNHQRAALGFVLLVTNWISANYGIN